jgi:hypothetical protein
VRVGHVIAALTLCAGPAAAEPTARTVIDRFGECALKRDNAHALEVIQTPVDDPNYKKLLGQLASTGCLDIGELTIPDLIFRGSIFAALYKRDFKHSQDDLRTVPKVDYLSGYKLPLSHDATNALAFAYLGDCVVRSDADAARDLIRYEPEAPSSKRAMTRIAAKLSACVDKGQTIAFSRDMISAGVAEGLYRLTVQAHRSAQSGVSQ